MKKASGERDEMQVVGGGESEEEEAGRFLQLRKIKVLQLMRSRAVGIDKRQNGFVNLNIFQLCFVELFQSVYRLRPAPSQAGGCLVITRSELCQ